MMTGKVIQVWHQDSPGVRVYVKRGWLKRLLYPKQFSAVGEHHLTAEELAPAHEQALELAKIFHGLYERYASSEGYTTRPETRSFNPHTPNGRLMQKVCLAIITGGYRLNDTADDTGPSAADIVSGLRLLPIRVLRTVDPAITVDEPAPDVQLQMRVVGSQEEASLALRFTDGQTVYIKVDDNEIITPPEFSRILAELGDFVNAQLFLAQSQLRVNAAEFWWKDEVSPDLEHSSRQQINPSVWESLLFNPTFQAQSNIQR